MTDRQLIDYALQAMDDKFTAQQLSQDNIWNNRLDQITYSIGQILTELSNVKTNCPMNDLRLRRLEDQGEKWEETTGQHHIIQVQQLQENAQWWKRWAATGIITVLAGAIGAVATVMLQGCVL